MCDFTIVRDTREKVGWWNFEFLDNCTQITKAVKTGDYTLLGYESVVAIERKRTVLEISRNLTAKYKQFQAELIRMQPFKYKYVLCEFSLSDILGFPENCGLKQSTIAQIKKTGKVLLKQINTIENNYGVPFLFCNNKQEAMEKALEIFRDVIKSN